MSAPSPQGTRRSLAEVDRQLGFLATALRTATNVFDPELIVLGGFLGALHALDPERLPRLVAAQALAASAETPRIVRAELGSDILMIGAAELAFGPLLASPRLLTRCSRRPNEPVGRDSRVLGHIAARRPL